jgi:hypothetical protein
MKKIPLLLLLLLVLPVFAQFTPLGEEIEEPQREIVNWFELVQNMLIMLMIIAVMMAAAGYMFAQFFGTETRARITTWSGSLLSAVGVSAIVLIIMYFFIGVYTGGAAVAPGIADIDFQRILERLLSIGQQALILMIMTLTVVAALAYAVAQIGSAQTRAKATVWANVLIGSSVVAAVIYILIFQILFPLAETFPLPEPLQLGREYTQVIALVIFLIAVIALIVYLAAKLFRVPEWEAYLNVELGNLVTSLLIIVFVAGFFSASKAVAVGITGEDSPPQAAIAVLEKITNNVLIGIRDVYAIQSCTAVLGTFHRRIGEAVLTPTFRVFPGIDTFVSITNVVGLGFVMAYGSLSAQITVLNFLDAIAEMFLLPAGLVLRFFPPTKEAGSFLIALSIGFYIIFPMNYYINFMVLEELQIEEYKTPVVLLTSLCGLSYVYFSVPVVVLGALAQTTAFRAVGLSTITGALSMKLSIVFNEAFINLLNMSMFIPILKSIARLSLLALFAPSVSMIFTIAFINAFTKFLVAKG